jgi:AcrR family transcriptional regulator
VFYKKETGVPIEVDRGRRHDAVVEAAARLISSGGLEGVTFRNLARELGCSTTSISHYFPTRNDVLLATYRHVAATVSAQREALMEQGRADVLTVLERILPIDETQTSAWRVWLCFWTSALFDPVLAEEQKQRSRATGEQIARFLRKAGWAARDATSGSREIMTAINGIAIQAIFDREAWPPDTQRKAIAALVDASGAAAKPRYSAGR